MYDAPKQGGHNEEYGQPSERTDRLRHKEARKLGHEPDDKILHVLQSSVPPSLKMQYNTMAKIAAADSQG